jgi:hypothetical protein
MKLAPARMQAADLIREMRSLNGPQGFSSRNDNEWSARVYEKKRKKKGAFIRNHLMVHTVLAFVAMQVTTHDQQPQRTPWHLSTPLVAPFVYASSVN